MLIPSYVPDVHLRLMLYKRIASTPSREELDELKVEIIDRFGPIPPFAQSLFRAAYLKTSRRFARNPQDRCRRQQRLHPVRGAEQDRTETRAQAHSRQPQEYRLDGPLKLRLPHRPYRGGALSRVEQLVDQLA